MARSERPHTPARDDNNDGDDDVWSVLLWAGGLHARRWLKASGPTPQRKVTTDDSNDGDDDDWSVLLWTGGLHARRWLEASGPTPQRRVTAATKTTGVCSCGPAVPTPVDGSKRAVPHPSAG